MRLIFFLISAFALYIFLSSGVARSAEPITGVPSDTEIAAYPFKTGFPLRF